MKPEITVVGLDGGKAPSSFVTARLMSTPLSHTGDQGTVEIIFNMDKMRVRARR